MIYCSHCGADNIDDGSFCVRCGSRLGHVDGPRNEAMGESADAPEEEHGDGADDSSPISADTERSPRRTRKRARWAVLAIALVLIVGGSVTAGVMLHRHGRGSGPATPTTATVHLTSAQSCTLKTLDVTKRLWGTPLSDWTSEISATQQLLLGRYGSGSKYLNAFNAAVSVGFQKAALDGARSAQISEIVPVAKACGSTHPQTFLGPAPKKKASPDFNVPAALVADGSHLWVANFNGSSVTELNLSDGSLVRVISGASYDFSNPEALVAYGSHLWVANYNGGSVIELTLSDGSLVRTISGSTQGITAPHALVADGSHLWVANSNSITELNLSDGSLARTFTSASYHINGPELASDGSTLWVANYYSNSLTELNLSDGSLVRTVSGAAYGFNGPDALASDGSHLWVANAHSNSVTELNLSDGSLVRTISGSAYGFDGPDALATDGSHLWVANGVGNSVTELNLSDGSFVRTISNAS